MTTFDAGMLGPAAASRRSTIRFRETVHGPVIGYATVDGQRVAISQKRSTRGREVVSALGFADLNANGSRSPRRSSTPLSKIEFTFNWFYADDEDIAMFSSGRLPDQRHAAWTRACRRKGTGKYEWNGLPAAVPTTRRRSTRRSGAIVNWNNKPASRLRAPRTTTGPTARSTATSCSRTRWRATDTTRCASLVGAMNRAATQDLRNQRVLPAIAGGAGHRPGAERQRAQQMLELLEDWRADGSSRLDVDLDGKIDDPGAAIMDAAWTRIADAVMSPVLGPQLDQLASLMGRDNRPSRNGSAYAVGLVRLRRQGPARRWPGSGSQGAFDTRFCGHGDLTTAVRRCGRRSTRPAPSWRRLRARSSTTGARTRFRSGSRSRRFCRRRRCAGPTGPTFQQVISYSDHR